MQLEGSIRTTLPGNEVLRGLGEIDTLIAIAPAGFTFREGAPGVTDFTIRRAFGPIALTLQGTMSLADKGAAHQLEIKAAHLIGGKVHVTLDMTSDPAEGLETLAWTGALSCQGLAGRLLAERADDANRILRNLFMRLRDHVEMA